MLVGDIYTMGNDSKILSSGKRFCLIFIPLVIITSAVLCGFLRQKLDKQRTDILSSERRNAGLLLRTATNSLQTVLVDLVHLTAQPTLYQMLEHDQPVYSRQLADTFLTFCRERGLYDQVRFIDETGMERVRVNFGQGQPYIVDDENLQDKAGRYYFTDTFKLEPSSVYVSPFDLNIEQGIIEQPLKPMIRFGIPIEDIKGNKRGIVVLNYLGANLIDDLEQTPGASVGFNMLLNVDGYWLKGSDPEDEWGFMYKDRKDRTLAKRDPLSWKRIQAGESGQFISKQGVYTFSTVYPLPKCREGSTGSTKALKPGESKGLYYHHCWKLVSFISLKEWRQQTKPIIVMWLSLFMIFLTALGLGTWQLASSITHRKLAGAERALAVLRMKEAMEEIKILSGFLPICSNCKKIRDDKGYWNQIETYIDEHSEAKFSHGVCPDCVKELYPDLLDEDELPE